MRWVGKIGVIAVLVAGMVTNSFSAVGWTWDKQSSGTSTFLTSVNFVNANTGWTVGYSGTILKTSNGGVNWISQTSGTTNNLASVQFTDSNTGWAVGDGGLILNTTNGGSTWTTQTSSITEGLTSVHFTDMSHGWAVSQSGAIILNTVNGGSTWNIQVPKSESAVGWQSVYFADTNNGWAIGSDNSSGLVFRTINSGSTWTIIPATGSPLVIPPPMLSCSFINDSIGWIAGAEIMKTRNGGSSWVPETSGISSDRFFSINFTDSSNGWAIGEGGKILKTSNGGNTWTLQTSGDSLLWAVYMVDTTTGWVVGDSGTILRYQEFVIDGIKSNLSESNDLKLELSTTQLSFTLPNTFSNPSSAAIFNLSGDRLIETPISKSNFSIPISNLLDGKYFLKVEDSKNRIVEPFEISR